MEENIAVVVEACNCSVNTRIGEYPSFYIDVRGGLRGCGDRLVVDFGKLEAEIAEAVKVVVVKNIDGEVTR